MKIVIQIRKQLREICIGQNMTIKSCGEDRSLVRKSFVYGFFMNAAQLHSDGLYSTVSPFSKILQFFPFLPFFLYIYIFFFF